MEEKIYLAALHRIGIGQKKLHKIFSKNNDYKSFYEKLNREVLTDKGYSSKQTDYILNSKKSLKIDDDIIKPVEKRGVKILSYNCTDYPEEFRNIINPPFVIYVRGKIPSGPKFSIVGSRKITSYGEKIIEKIGTEISNYFTIVSGGAAGCDTHAHNVAIKNGSKTISIIGTGIDQDYPTGNKKLFDDISEKHGAVISIFPIGEVGNPYNFPIRNELVAGISNGTLIVEAQEKSGTLITANLVLDSGRDLFAVPGDIFKSSSTGCNNLIVKGNAKAVLGSEDILSEYNIGLENNNKKEKIKFADKIEENIYNLVILESMNSDQLSKKLGIDISTISFKLSIMEISGLIKKTMGGFYEVK